MDSERKDAEVVTIDVYAAKNLLSQGHRYLDVRAEEDYKRGHVETALNIPYYLNTPEGRVKNPEFVDQVLSIYGKEGSIIVGCGTGTRSVLATTDLRNAEFNNVFNMGGGYKAWAGNGFPVNKSDSVES
ncbi:hypothetical protein ACJIZ3_013298 [Penstemon smallii]|uniref:Rhodanese domain-containing protein n=1 Tax=Penstemon smallii TaxID=265156 RepID=A0ABD3URJ1_9LAMI